MEVIITKGYIKDLARLPKPVIAAADAVIDKLKAAKSLQDSGVHFEKMEGQKKGENYYRIRTGEYRIGIENIKQSRLNRLYKDKEIWDTTFVSAGQIVPSLSCMLIVNIVNE